MGTTGTSSLVFAPKSTLPISESKSYWRIPAFYFSSCEAVVCLPTAKLLVCLILLCLLPPPLPEDTYSVATGTSCCRFFSSETMFTKSGVAFLLAVASKSLLLASLVFYWLLFAVYRLAYFPWATTPPLAPLTLVFCVLRFFMALDFLRSASRRSISYCLCLRSRWRR